MDLKDIKKCYKYKEIFENLILRDVMIIKDSKVIRNVIHVGVKECRIKK